MSGERVEVVLCGAGRMGRNHLRLLQEIPLFRLKAVVDPALAGTEVLGAKVVATLDEIDDASYTAAVIATPTETHHRLAKALLERGKHVLVEKPFAATVAECNELIALSTAKGCKMAVGHVERFNPVIRKVLDVLRSGFCGTPIHFSFTRVGGYPESVKDGNNVLLDLAVHDLDILRMLVGPSKLVASVSHDTLRKGVFDTAEILLRADGGASASVHVNWLSPTKIRTLRITCSQGVLFADLILQTCMVYGGNILRRGPEPRIDFAELAEDYRNSDRVEFGVRKQEPLRKELEAFHQFLRGEPTDICSVGDGTDVVGIALDALARAG